MNSAIKPTVHGHFRVPEVRLLPDMYVSFQINCVSNPRSGATIAEERCNISEERRPSLVVEVVVVVAVSGERPAASIIQRQGHVSVDQCLVRVNELCPV